MNTFGLAALYAVLVSAGFSDVPQGGQGGAGISGELNENETVANHILTPGDKTDWPIEVKAGEAVIIKVRSEVFDAAVEVTNEDGKIKIAANDDVAPGQQNAQVLAYFEKAGKYRIRVLNYRSSAGGPYELRTRKIGSIQGQIGQDVDLPKYTEDGPRYVRYVLKKDRFYVFGALDYAQMGQQILDLNGNLIRLEAGSLLRPKEDGQYFLPAWAPGYGVEDRKPRARSLELSPKAADLKSPPLASKTSGLPYELWWVAVGSGELVRLSMPLKEGHLIPLEQQAQDPKLNRAPEWKAIATAPKNGNTSYVLAKDGIKMLVLVRTRGADKPYQIELTNGCTDWDAVSPVQGDLPIGGIHVFRVRGKRADYYNLVAQAKTFDIRSTLFYSDGNRYVEIDDSNEGLNAAINAVLPQNDTYYYMVDSFGGGGGGAYTISGQKAQPEELKLDEKKLVEFKTPVSGTLVFDGKEGQELVAEITDGHLQAAWAPNGEGVDTQSVQLSGRVLTYIRIKHTGQHRLMLARDKVTVGITLSLVPK